MQAFDAGVVPTRSKSRSATWILWADYCTTHSIDPFLTNVEDSLPILQVFAQRYRTGALAPNQKPVKSRTVEAALRAVGQTLASVGADDPRYDRHGNVHFVIQQMLKGFTRSDPSVTRVQPLPFAVVNHAVTFAITPTDIAAADLAVVGFFFLLRPGEHTSSAPTADSHPFRLCDVIFRVGASSIPAATGDPALIQLATFVALTFTKQKNGTENEVVGHARSGHANTCPVLALIRRCLHLRSHLAVPTTPLCTVYLLHGASCPITPSIITTLLRRSAALLHNTLGINPSDVSARSLRAGGAMALLNANVDPTVIKLIGRWRSDEMLRYLHLQAYPQMRTYAPAMAANHTIMPQILRQRFNPLGTIFLLCDHRDPFAYHLCRLRFLYQKKKKSHPRMVAHSPLLMLLFLGPNWGNCLRKRGRKPILLVKCFPPKPP